MSHMSTGNIVYIPNKKQTCDAPSLMKKCESLKEIIHRLIKENAASATSRQTIDKKQLPITKEPKKQNITVEVSRGRGIFSSTHDKTLINSKQHVLNSFWKKETRQVVQLFNAPIESQDSCLFSASFLDSCDRLVSDGRPMDTEPVYHEKGITNTSTSEEKVQLVPKVEIDLLFSKKEPYRSPTLHNCKYSSSAIRTIFEKQEGKDFPQVKSSTIYPHYIKLHRKGRGHAVQFPEKIHFMLEETTKANLTKIVSWEANGKIFCIHDTKEFVNKILGRYFRHKKWESFQRQLNIYGFQKIKSDYCKKCYYHSFFLRSNPNLCLKIERIKVKGLKGKTAVKSHIEPGLQTLCVGQELKNKIQTPLSKTYINVSSNLQAHHKQEQGMLSLNKAVHPKNNKDKKYSLKCVKKRPFKNYFSIHHEKKFKPRSGRGHTVQFPEKMYTMLEQAAQLGMEDIVSWNASGCAFGIHNLERFVEIIMPKHFKQSKWTSFQRQLNLYDFKRYKCGPESGSYYHEFFLRYKPELCQKIKRIEIKGVKKIIPGK